MSGQLSARIGPSECALSREATLSLSGNLNRDREWPRSGGNISNWISQLEEREQRKAARMMDDLWLEDELSCLYRVDWLERNTAQNHIPLVRVFILPLTAKINTELCSLADQRKQLLREARSAPR